MKKLLVGLLLIASSHISFAEDAPISQKVVELHIQLPEPPQKEEKNKKTPRIENFGRATCSGAFIDAGGDIITARHCTEIAQSIEVQTYDNRTYLATIFATSTTHDLAIIHIDRRDTPFFTLAKDLTQGESVGVYGSPLALTGVLTAGIVAKIEGDRTLIDVTALPGNSGGPLFNERGELCGVVTSGFIVFFGTTHLNVAQSLDAVTFFIYKSIPSYREVFRGLHD